ncbi:MAG: PfkB family carbohydrate kinase [bacterium]|nr:PfkB family carbohydrate kinase [bacterium]
MTSAPIYVCVGSIFIDDIVFPDGRTQMEVLGGAGTHAAAGVAVWRERPGLIANGGVGMPESAWKRLERDFDVSGVQWVDVPQGRAWQIFEWDNRRIEIFRTPDMSPFAFYPDPTAIPESFHHPQAATVLRGVEGFVKWRAFYRDAIVLWEPDSLYMQPANRDEYRAHLALADIVSPNLIESQAILGLQDPVEIVRQMIGDGARIVALRMGERGSLVGGQDGTLIEVPPAPVPRIVDQTGAGNTYCGGFLVGWNRTRDLKTAGCYGAVAASFALETFGLADPSAKNIAAARDYRFAYCMKYAKVL